MQDNVTVILEYILTLTALLEYIDPIEYICF